MFEIFKDNNEWNEKAIVGFVAFALMVVVMLVDTVSGAVGKDLIINEFNIYKIFFIYSFIIFIFVNLY